MPVKRAATKALRQNRAARERNSAVKLQLKKTSVRLRKALTAKQFDQAKSIAAELVRQLDKAVQRGVIHHNAAARKKSRVAAKLARSRS